jgi:hypothetical protein
MIFSTVSELRTPSSVRQTRQIGRLLSGTISSKYCLSESERQTRQREAVVAFCKTEMDARHRDARQRMSAAHEKRWQAETRQQRAQRLPKGFSGIWHRLTGQYSRIKAQNERETLEADRHDRAEKDALIFKQIEEWQALQRDVQVQRAMAQQELLRRREDVSRYQNLDRGDGNDPHSRDRNKRDDAEIRRQPHPERHHRHRCNSDP